ncbi:MAG: hypothetical protein ACYTHK_11050 [Planctomycetota bacterium]|jgi:hypothetical protein
MRQYLWKEWREFRAVAIGLSVALPLLFAIAAFALPERVFGDRDAGSLFATIGGVGAMLIALFAITTDLFAGEVRRGRMRFLGRLPAGLGRPFAAKAIVFLVGVGGFFLYGFHLGAWTVTLRDGDTFALSEMLTRTWYDGSWRWKHEVIWAAMLVLLALPVSCFAPRGVLTLPITVLLGAGFVAPIVAISKWHPGFFYGLQSRSLLGWIQGFLILVPVLAGWVAFVRGYRAGGGWPRAMKWGLIVLLLAAVAPMFPKAHAFLVSRGLAQGRESLGAVYLGADGRYLYVTRFSYINDQIAVPLAPIRYDLESGSHVELERGYLSNLGHSFRSRLPVAQPYLQFDDRVLDTRTGELVDVDLFEATRAVDRTATHMRDATGKRVWVEGKRLRSEEGVLAEDNLLRYATPMGLGMRLVHGQSVLDPFRGEVVRIRRFRLARHLLRIRPGAWLIRDPRGGGWQLFDVERECARDAVGLDGKLIAVLEDGRVLVQGTHALDLVDPETGMAWPLRYEDGSRATAGAIKNAAGFGVLGCPARDKRGRRIFEIDRRLARLEGTTLVRTPDTDSRYVMLIACGDGDICYALDGDRAVMRLQFGGTTVDRLIHATR